MSGSVVIQLHQSKVQVAEKVRIDVSKTFAFSGRSISTIVVKPVHDGSDSYDVTSAGFLDIAYSSAGTKTVQATLTLDNADTVVLTKDITVVSEATENLFSSDSQIISHEPDILNYLPEGYCDYRFVHRLAQSRILGQLDERGITDTDGNRILAADVIDVEECRSWSKFLVLQFIFESLSNSVDDIFFEKSLRYKQMAEKSSNRAFLRLDYDGDGTLEKSERGTASVGRIVRR